MVAVLAIYGLSLTILGLFQWIGQSGFETDFQRGHSAVSAFWGVIALIALRRLTRDLRVLRLAGFALFGLALAKLFLYDLANLSSITRALSFLAVGGVLLLAGFFYQRLAAVTERPRRVWRNVARRRGAMVVPRQGREGVDGWLSARLRTRPRGEQRGPALSRRFVKPS